VKRHGSEGTNPDPNKEKLDDWCSWRRTSSDREASEARLGNAEAYSPIAPTSTSCTVSVTWSACR